jgi:outer membrane protein OmpA-like peptidoglycan-associated protein
LFLVGALFGIYMFVRHLKRRAIPAWSAILHGVFGATAFGLVLLVMLKAPEIVLIRQSLVILIAAIVLGTVNLLFHVRRVRHRTVLIILHAGTAVTGVGTLAYGGIIASPGETGTPNPPAPAAPVHSAPLVAMGDTSAASVATAAPKPVEAQKPAETPKPVEGAAVMQAAAPPPAFPLGPAWADSSVTFDNASAVLNASARAAVAQMAKDLQSHPDIKLVEVQGYTDEKGDDAFNIPLSRARSSAVLEALVADGVSRSRLRSAAYGDRCPADPSCQGPNEPASCHQPSSWERDRRVSLMALEVGGDRFHGKVACDRGMSLAPQEDRKYGGN